MCDQGRAMTDHPIIFSAPMIRAMLDGRKTMTRRLVTPTWQRVRACDRLWVRESFATDVLTNRPKYKATFESDMAATFAAYRDYLPRDPLWRPAIYMPRWASRLTLTVTVVKIERLNDISTHDAQAEGIDVGPLSASGCKNEFRQLWESLHGAGSWAANPEVVALTFTVAKQNIDERAESAMKRAAGEPT